MMKENKYKDNWPHYGYHRYPGSTKGGQDVCWAALNQYAEQRWLLHLYDEATEEDVENSVADDVGEILLSREVAIDFCPFCGKNLNDELPAGLKRG